LVNLLGCHWQTAQRYIWDIESPAEYKKWTCRKEERVEEVVEPENLEPEVEKVGQLRGNFG
jgi:hypothetical protein